MLPITGEVRKTNKQEIMLESEKIEGKGRYYHRRVIITPSVVRNIACILCAAFVFTKIFRPVRSSTLSGIQSVKKEMCLFYQK